jgi:Bacterial RNA polymerase, alpha chain C terminal domain
MTSYNPDPNLPDHVSINQVGLPPRIKWALVAAGLKTVGDVRKTSDATLLSIQNLGHSSLTRLRNELGRRVTRQRSCGGPASLDRQSGQSWAMPARPPRPQKITLREMRASGVRGLLVYCSDYHCGHWTAISGDQMAG